jgi:serine/threonine protein phosphatase PrpC
MTLLLRSAARSDVGLVRKGNEDSGYAGSELLVVADGMGGHAAGELASAAAIATLAELETEGLNDADAVLRLSSSVTLTSERIADIVAAQPEFAGMGTTVTALAWLRDPPRVALVHVGDSRAYLLRDGTLVQLTRDHTYVQSLVDSGKITAEQALVHPRRNLLMRTIDGIHEAEPDISVREARPGDRYLVCSDGLSGVVSDERLVVLLQLPDPTAAVTALVDAALEGGSPDNVTCVVADVVDVEGAEDLLASRGVVVGAAGEIKTRDRLPTLHFPIDSEPDPDAGPTTGYAGRLVRVNTASNSTESGAAALAQVYAEEQRAPRNFRRSRIIAVILCILVVIAIIIGLITAWARGQWYVGDSNGYVAVYQGVPASIGPLAMHHVVTQSTLAITSLPTFEAGQVQATIYASSLANADATMVRLKSRAQACITTPTTAGCPQVAP